MMTEDSVDAELLRDAKSLNESIPKFTVNKMVNALREKSRESSRVLGLSYKGNSGDICNSPALEIVEELKRAGIKNFVSCDPFVNVSSVNQVGTIEKAMDGTDCAIIATDHAVFRKLDFPEDMVIVDGRNMLNGRIASENYYGLGRGRKGKL